MKVSVFLVFFFAAISISAVSLNVKFTSKGSKPAIKYIAVYNLADLSEIATADMSTIDEYVFEVPENTAVFVLGAASSGKSSAGYYIHEFMPVTKALTVGAEAVTVELVTEPSFQLVLQNVDFPATGELFAVDMDDRFVPVFRLDVSNSSGKNLPALNLPLEKCYAFYVLKELPQSGKMVYRIDNGGSGYCADLQGNMTVDTDKAVAESTIARYEALLSETVADTTSHLEKMKEIKGLYDNKEYRTAAGEAVFQSEELIFQEAVIDIEMYRKGHITVECRNKHNDPLKDISIKAVSKKAEYKRGVLAGVYDLDPSIFENAFADGFNFATAGTLWLDVEPTDDAYRWEYMDKVAGNKTIYDFGYELFGHSILYFIDFIMPDYLKNMSKDELSKEVTEHTTDLVTHYKDHIQEWLVINEAHAYSASNGLSREDITGITKTAISAVDAANPDAVKTINAAPDFFGQNVFVESFVPDHEKIFSMNSYDYFKDLIGQEVKFDVIGQQLYNGGCVTLFKDNGLAETASAVTLYDLVEVRRQLKKMETLGKPVYVTEISVPAAMNDSCPDMGYWRKEWDEEVQSAFLERLLTIIMGESDVHAVTYWDMQDKGSFIYKGGLIDEGGRKKESYGMMTSKFREFSKTVDAVTGENGKAELDLFAGEYEIMINGEDKPETVVVRESGYLTLECVPDVEAVSDDGVTETDEPDEKESGCAVTYL